MTAAYLLATKHNDYLYRVIEPLWAALGGQSPFRWVEEAADRAAVGRGNRSFVQFDTTYRRSLSITDATYVQPLSRGGTKRNGWTGSIVTEGNSHAFSVFLSSGYSDIRALEAHEIGHAVLYSDDRVRELVCGNSLLVDPAVERLVDDVARALLLPQSLLRQLLGDARNDLGEDSAKSTLWLRLPAISRAALAPLRLTVSRLAPQLLPEGGAVLCYSMPAPAQLDIFQASRPLDSGRRTATSRWIMSYRKVDRSKWPFEYMFSDRIGSRRPVVLKGTDLEEARDERIGGVSSALVAKIAGPKCWPHLSKFSTFYRRATVTLNERIYYLVSCE